MANVFPRWMNWLPLKASVVLGVVAVGVVAAATYYLPPSYSAVGYQPEQPIPFSHKIHVEQNGMDCRYCHSFVDRAAHSNVPTAQTCWGCHEYVKKESPQLVNLRRAMDPTFEHYDGKPIRWTQVHRTPDYVKFNHSAHINRGVSCVECHGRVDQMEVVYQAKPLTMGFCLECHRSPEKALRPLERITDLGWSAAGDAHTSARVGQAAGERLGALEEEIARLSAEQDAVAGANVRVRKEMLGHQIQAVEHNHEQLREIHEAWTKQDQRNLNSGQPEGLKQRELGLFLRHSWNVNPPVQCNGCHR